MSQSVSNVDIEDILASIRRLVAAPADVATAPARLVLTPALRVAGEEGRAQAGEGDDRSGTVGPQSAGPNASDSEPLGDAPPRPPYLLVAPLNVDPAPRPEPSVGRTADGQDPARLAVDEGILRALVADAVRRELEGAMGERITENLRRLVRREVAVALRARSGR